MTVSAPKQETQPIEQPACVKVGKMIEFVPMVSHQVDWVLKREFALRLSTAGAWVEGNGHDRLDVIDCRCRLEIAMENIPPNIGGWCVPYPGRTLELPPTYEVYDDVDGGHYYPYETPAKQLDKMLPLMFYRWRPEWVEEVPVPELTAEIVRGQGGIIRTKYRGGKTIRPVWVNCDGAVMYGVAPFSRFTQPGMIRFQLPNTDKYVLYDEWYREVVLG